MARYDHISDFSEEDKGHLQKIASHLDSLHETHPTKQSVKRHAANDDHNGMVDETRKIAHVLGLGISVPSVLGIAWWLLKHAKRL